MPGQPVKNDPPFSEKIVVFLRQWAITLVLHKTAFEFIREHRPWRGLRSFGWILWAIVAAGALLSYQFFQEVFNAIGQLRTDQTSFSAGLASVFSLEKIGWMVQGSRKYLVMIVLELLVFYSIQKTLQITIGKKPDFSRRAFIDAEVRIFKVTILAWAMESVVRLLVVQIAMGMLHLDFLAKPAGFFIQSYFLGFALIDNYHECFELKVAESQQRTFRLATGVSVAAGMVAFCFMYVPLVGAVIATMLGAVVATLAMERFAPVTEVELAAIAFLKKKPRKKT
ncbi:MAG: hypothetical protein HY842_20415 [Bacteroidetes bacterium]|nr:hypothetical protein [Bacteroidota bacterium]